MDNKPTIEEEIVKMLKTVYDPEIPVNIYDLGLVYNVEVNDGAVKIEMTLTAPNCPAADFIIEDVRMKLESIENVKSVDIQLPYCLCPGLRLTLHLISIWERDTSKTRWTTNVASCAGSTASRPMPAPSTCWATYSTTGMNTATSCPGALPASSASWPS